ncbi:ADP-ribosylation factor-like protein 2 isoform X5 [Macaca nemestrina]|uniref:ADP-ribosylation factor-like protein 2 isoform X5 n=1 Tax=Macaca nemestrina TaxID=9545 RepID=UPI0039B8D404
MGLLTILKKMKQKERELRLLMLGLDNAGKTTILKKFNGEDIDTISPTLGFNIKTLEHRGAWPEPPSSSLPTSRTCLEHCPLTPSARPWSWTPSAATTGASRAAAPSPGRTCCQASTGSWMTFPAASSQLTEPLQMSLHLAVQVPQPSPNTIHGGMGVSQPN